MEADALVDSVCGQLTNLVDELRLHAIESQQFTETLNEYALDWSERSGIEVNIIKKGTKSCLEHREILFRIAQEALANIARHSAAKMVNLNLDYGVENIMMTIEDNGSGFDTNA